MRLQGQGLGEKWPFRKYCIFNAIGAAVGSCWKYASSTSLAGQLQRFNSAKSATAHCNQTAWLTQVSDPSVSCSCFYFSISIRVTLPWLQIPASSLTMCMASESLVFVFSSCNVETIVITLPSSLHTLATVSFYLAPSTPFCPSLNNCC